MVQDDSDQQKGAENVTDAAKNTTIANEEDDDWVNQDLLAQSSGAVYSHTSPEIRTGTEIKQ